MKLKDFSKSKKELEREIAKNNAPQLKYDEQYRMSRTNQTDYKLATTFFFSLLSYLGIFFASMFSLATFDTPLFIESMPPIAYPFVVLGGSVGLGSIARHLMEKKFKLKERLAAFTNAKNDTEKLVEEVKNEIELKKIATRNLALNKAIEKLNDDEKILRYVSSKYDTNDKEEKTPAKSQENISSLLGRLQEKYKELDSLVTKKTISDKFWIQREKNQNLMFSFLSAGVSGLGSMLYFTFTLIIATANSATPILQGIPSSVIAFTPFVLGSAIGGIYYNVRNKKHQKAFAALNDILGEEALVNNGSDTYQERQTLDNQIDNIVSEIVDITLELQEEKRYLEKFEIVEPEESKDLDINKTKSQTPQLTSTFEEEYDSPQFEEPSYEGMTPRSSLRREIKKLTLKRNKLDQDQK